MKRYYILIIVLLALLVISNVDFSPKKGNNKIKEKPKQVTMKVEDNSTPDMLTQKQKLFKDWAINNTAVTYFEYPNGSDYQIWIKMTTDKYSTKQNAELIAQQIGRYYKQQTGYTGLVIVSVWDYNNKIFAKGKVK